MSCEIVDSKVAQSFGKHCPELNVNLFCVSKSRLVWLKMVLNVNLKRCF